MSATSFGAGGDDSRPHGGSLGTPPAPAQLTIDGELLKAEGMARADAGTDDWWRSTCDQAIEQAAATGRPFQAFDLCEWFGLPEPRSAAQWGPRLSAAAKRGVIRAVGYTSSSRPTTAKSAVRVWQGAA